MPITIHYPLIANICRGTSAIVGNYRHAACIIIFGAGLDCESYILSVGYKSTIPLATGKRVPASLNGNVVSSLGSVHTRVDAVTHHILYLFYKRTFILWLSHLYLTSFAEPLHLMDGLCVLFTPS